MMSSCSISNILWYEYFMCDWLISPGQNRSGDCTDVVSMHRCTKAIPGSDLGLTDWIGAKSALWQICCFRLCLYFIWGLINFIQVDGSPLCIFHVIVSDEIGQKSEYRQVSSIRRTLVGNQIVDHSDVVGASPVGAAPTTSSFST